MQTSSGTDAISQGHEHEPAEAHGVWSTDLDEGRARLKTAGRSQCATLNRLLQREGRREAQSVGDGRWTSRCRLARRCVSGRRSDQPRASLRVASQREPFFFATARWWWWWWKGGHQVVDLVPLTSSLWRSFTSTTTSNRPSTSTCTQRLLFLT